MVGGCDGGCRDMVGGGHNGFALGRQTFCRCLIDKSGFPNTFVQKNTFALGFSYELSKIILRIGRYNTSDS
jgi:hypothetical protein